MEDVYKESVVEKVILAILRGIFGMCFIGPFILIVLSIFGLFYLVAQHYPDMFRALVVISFFLVAACCFPGYLTTKD